SRHQSAQVNGRSVRRVQSRGSWTSLSRPVAPRNNCSRDVATPSARARSTITASFAAPSCGLARTLTTSRPSPISRASDRAPGVTRSARRPSASASAWIASGGGSSIFGFATEHRQVAPREGAVALGLEADLLDLVPVLRAQELRRTPDPDLARVLRLARAQQFLGRLHLTLADPRIVHRHRAHADEGAVFKRGSVDHRHVSDHAVLADDRRAALGVGPRTLDVEDAAVLHIRARADLDAVDVTPEHAIVPHARLGPERHVDNDPRTGGDEGGLVDLRDLALERKDGRPGKAAGAIVSAGHWPVRSARAMA